MMQRGGPRPHVQRLLLYVYAYTKDSKIVEPELLVEVEAGMLDDCRDGVTLRSYLAKTLRCAPMRVSKKLAGKCIGSKVLAR